MEYDGDISAMVEKFIAESNSSRSETQQDGLDCDGDLLETKVQEVLNTMQNYKFDLDRKYEKQREEKERLRRDIELQRSRLNQSKVASEEAEDKLESTRRELETQQQQLAETKAKVEQLLEDIPKLTQIKQLHYSVSRITFDKSSNKNQIKGFVVNSRKDDVNTFDFNYSNPAVTKQFVTNYLWDVIASGVNPVWDNM